MSSKFETLLDFAKRRELEANAGLDTLAVEDLNHTARNDGHYGTPLMLTGENIHVASVVDGSVHIGQKLQNNETVYGSFVGFCHQSHEVHMEGRQIARFKRIGAIVRSFTGSGAFCAPISTTDVLALYETLPQNEIVDDITTEFVQDQLDLKALYGVASKIFRLDERTRKIAVGVIRHIAHPSDFISAIYPWMYSESMGPDSSNAITVYNKMRVPIGPNDVFSILYVSGHKGVDDKGDIVSIDVGRGFVFGISKQLSPLNGAEFNIPILGDEPVELARSQA